MHSLAQAFSYVCAKATTITFAAVSKALEVEEDDVELWTIEAIKAGLVEARIDEVAEKHNLIATEEDLDTVLAVNLKGPFFLTQQAAHLLRAAAGNAIFVEPDAECVASLDVLGHRPDVLVRTRVWGNDGAPFDNVRALAAAIEIVEPDRVGVGEGRRRLDHGARRVG